MEVPSKAKLNVNMHILLYTIDFMFGTFQADTRALKLNAWKQLALEEGMYPFPIYMFMWLLGQCRWIEDSWMGYVCYRVFSSS